MKSVRVILADDHRMFVSGIKKLLEAEPDLRVVATAISDAEVISAVHRTAPDIVLLDLHLPERGGIQAIHAIKAAAPLCVVIMLTMDPSEELAVTAIRAGANGYLLKEHSAEELTDFIRAALRGEIVISPTITPGVLRGLTQLSRQPATASGLTKLSPREFEILGLIARGLTNREISEILLLSENTVRHHTTNIYHKLGVTNRSQAVRQAFLLQGPPSST